MAYITWSKNKKRGSAVFEAYASGGKDAALKALNQATPAVITIKTKQLIPQQERMAALAIIDDREQIMREVAAHEQGKLAIMAQVHGIALLGASVRGVAEAPSQLEALATQLENEGGKLVGALKTKLRTFADLAGAMGDKPLSSDSGTAARRYSASEGPMARLVVMAALAKSMERAGGDATEIRTKIREFTNAFDA